MNKMSQEELMNYIRDELKDIKEWLKSVEGRLDKLESQVMAHLIQFDYSTEQKKVWQDRLFSIIVRVVSTMILVGIGAWVGIKFT